MRVAWLGCSFKQRGKIMTPESTVEEFLGDSTTKNPPRLTFQHLHGNRIFNLLGLGVGKILTEGSKSYLVFSQDMGRDAMEEFLGKEFYLPDNKDVIRINEQMRSADLAANLPTLVSAFLLYDLPTDYNPENTDFGNNPHPDSSLLVSHGWLYNHGRPRLQINSLVQGLRTLNWAAQQEHIKPETAVFLFKKMVQRGLHYTEEEYQRELERLHPGAHLLRKAIDFVTDLCSGQAWSSKI